MPKLAKNPTPCPQFIPIIIGKWYQLSAAQGYKNSEGAYATLTFKMTRADVTEANERVARFSVVKELKPNSEVAGHE